MRRLRDVLAASSRIPQNELDSRVRQHYGFKDVSYTEGHIIEVAVATLILDPEVQARTRTVQTVVDEYAEAMRAGAVFPPLDVFVVIDDNGNYYHYVADGFHRAKAAHAAKIPSITCRVHLGDKRDAILFSVGANTSHGLKRTRADLHRAVAMLLHDPEWAQRSSSWMASQCGVNTKTVVAARKRLGLFRDEIITRTGARRAARADRQWNPLADKLVDLAHQQRSLTDICDAMAMSPKQIHELAEKARRIGRQIDLPTDFTDRLEHRLRAEVRDLNAAKKHLLDELEKREVQIEALTALSQAPLAPVVAKRGRGEGKRRQGTLCMLLSDLHVEEPVAPEKVNGLNEYNLDIADRCIERCAEAFEYFANDPRWDIQTGILGILGDTYSGYIHAELAETNFLSPVQAVLWVQERLEKLIRYVLAHTKLERLIIVCHDGNHGRLTMKVRAQTRKENSLEWLMYKQLASRFENEPRVQFVVEDGLYTYVDVYDETFAFTHGDQFRYQGGVGGLLIPVRRGLNEIRKYRPGLKRNVIFCMGHFHERMDVGDIVINGSAIGVTPYSLSINVKPERRAQHIFLVDSQRGKDAPTAPIWLPLK